MRSKPGRFLHLAFCKKACFAILSRAETLVIYVYTLKGMCRLDFKLSGTVKSNSTGTEYHSLVNVTCNSSNLNYMIECTICRIQYVGQAKNKILSRINQHYSSIKNLVDTPVSRHINSHSFEGFYPIRIYILTLIREDVDSIEAAENRNKWENYWMARLYSYVPRVLNIKD